MALRSRSAARDERAKQAAAQERRAVRPPDPHPSGATPPALPTELIPRHVALVMDGNGRWANRRGLTRIEGHRAGEEVLLDVVAGAIQAGVKHLSVYAVSYTHLTLPTKRIV